MSFSRLLIRSEISVLSGSFVLPVVYGFIFTTLTVKHQPRPGFHSILYLVQIKRECHGNYFLLIENLFVPSLASLPVATAATKLSLNTEENMAGRD